MSSPSNQRRLRGDLTDLIEARALSAFQAKPMLTASIVTTAEPDVYWSEHGIDASLGLQRPLYVFPSTNHSTKEE